MNGRRGKEGREGGSSVSFYSTSIISLFGIWERMGKGGGRGKKRPPQPGVKAGGIRCSGGVPGVVCVGCVGSGAGREEKGERGGGGRRGGGGKVPFFFFIPGEIFRGGLSGWEVGGQEREKREGGFLMNNSFSCYEEKCGQQKVKTKEKGRKRKKGGSPDKELVPILGILLLGFWSPWSHWVLHVQLRQGEGEKRRGEKGTFLHLYPTRLCFSFLSSRGRIMRGGVGGEEEQSSYLVLINLGRIRKGRRRGALLHLK